MECPDFGLCVSQGCGVFPGTVAGTVSFPFDVVLEFRSIASSSQFDDARVGDCFDFVLFFAIHDDWVGRWRLGETVVPIWRQPVDMKNGMELEPTWKFEFEIQVADSFENFKRSKLTRS